MKSEIVAMTEAIIRSHDGKAYYNFGEVSKIIGCSINSVAHVLHVSGITVKKIGPSKRVSAYDIAQLMCDERIAPIDTTSRGITLPKK